jgi:hypothetical protein
VVCCKGEKPSEAEHDTLFGSRNLEITYCWIAPQAMSQNTSLTTSGCSNLSQTDDSQFHLWCWLWLDDVDLDSQEKLSRIPFSIKIPRDSYFDALSEAIKEKKANTLKDIDADDLKLWVVASPLTEGGVDVDDAMGRVTGEPIFGATRLKAKFGDESTNSEHILVVVRKRGTYALATSAPRTG